MDINKFYNNIKSPSMKLERLNKSRHTWVVVFFSSLILLPLMFEFLIYPLFFLSIIAMLFIIINSINIFTENIKIKKKRFLFVNNFGDEESINKMRENIANQIHLYKARFLNISIVIILACIFVVAFSLIFKHSGLFPVFLGLFSGLFLSIINGKLENKINKLHVESEEIINVTIKHHLTLNDNVDEKADDEDKNNFQIIV